jgi:SAM-dependent methyltransferase
MQKLFTPRIIYKNKYLITKAFKIMADDDVKIHVEKDQYSTEELAENYKLFLTSRAPELRYVQTPSIRKLLNNSLKGQRVIDLACGHGGSTRILADLNPEELIGVDLSPEQVKMAIKESADDEKYAKIKYMVRDCCEPLNLGEFDLVFSKHLLNYAETKEKLNKMVSSMFEATKKGHVCAGLMFSPFLESKHYEKMFKYGLDMHRPNPVEVFVKMYNGDVKTSRHLMNLRIFMWAPTVFEQAFKDAGFQNFEWVKAHLEEDPEGKHLFHKDFVDYSPIILFKAIRPSN